MAFLKYIPDDKLVFEVRSVIEVAVRAKEEASDKFGANVIDPFAAFFEISGFSVSHKDWKSSEMVRQSQKTLQNHVGNFHQQILGHVEGWRNLGVGSEVDLICDQKKIIAEVKNKYSTVTGGKLKDVYIDLEKLVMPKASAYKGYTSYLVNILPRKPERFNEVFTPSDKSKGNRCARNELIRIIDGASFYALVTGREYALRELFEVLPDVFKRIGGAGMNPKDVGFLRGYFASAYDPE